MSATRSRRGLNEAIIVRELADPGVGPERDRHDGIRIPAERHATCRFLRERESWGNVELRCFMRNIAAYLVALALRLWPQPTPHPGFIAG
jgi:hypothetical protein